VTEGRAARQRLQQLESVGNDDVLSVGGAGQILARNHRWPVCCEAKLRHLDVKASPRRASLSQANARRPWQLYEAVFYQLLTSAQSLAPTKRFRFKNKLFSLNATVIDLCWRMFEGRSSPKPKER
jgi:hypothetical protein